MTQHLSCGLSSATGGPIGLFSQKPRRDLEKVTGGVGPPTSAVASDYCTLRVACTNKFVLPEDVVFISKIKIHWEEQTFPYTII